MAITSRWRLPVRCPLTERFAVFCLICVFRECEEQVFGIARSRPSGTSLKGDAMKARFNTAAATVIAACFLSIAAGCGDEFWQGEKPAPPPAPKAQDFCVAEDGKAVDCDDKNACTDDTCDPKKGCAHANNKAACDDGNPCTTGDWCAVGACQSGTAVNCDDGNPCTTDKCASAAGKAGCVSMIF